MIFVKLHADFVFLSMYVLMIVLHSEIRKLDRLWHPWEREKVGCFTLSDLWKFYDEWSAYGGVSHAILLLVFTYI